MTEKEIFHSSFDSTRYTGKDQGTPNHPNLAHAQAEAVTSLLLGRTLVVNNTYAFDSGSVVNLVGALLDARQDVLSTCGAAGRHRIAAANPLVLRWYGGADFLSCCVDQLRRLEPPTRRFILSHWTDIDGDDRARAELADALASPSPEPPAAIRASDRLRKSFEIVVRLNDYCRGPGRGMQIGAPEISLQKYLQDFEQLERPEIESMISRMDDRYQIDIGTAMRLRDEVSAVDPDDQKNRGWAHEAVNRERWPEATDIDPFLLEQRQLIDTLYNAVLADSAGSDIDLLSSAPRTAGSARLEQANAFALQLIRHSKLKPGTMSPAQDRRIPADLVGARHPMSELFEAVTAQPHLPAPPLRHLLQAYWKIIADDEMRLPWRDSCNQLEYALLRAEQRQQAGLPADAHLAEIWEAHMTTLQLQLPHLRTDGLALITPIGLDNQAFQVVTSTEVDSNGDAGDNLAESLAAAEYIDRYLRIIPR